MSVLFTKNSFSVLCKADIIQTNTRNGGSRMNIVSSPDRVDAYLKEYRIAEFFSCDPVFTLRRYLPGEMLTSPFAQTRLLQFIVEGEVILYDMPNEDTVAEIETPAHKARMIGDAELFDPDFPTFFVEAKTEVYTLSLPLKEYRGKLLDDNTFLRYLCRGFTVKLAAATSPEYRLPLREQLVRYIESSDKDTPIRDMKHLAYLLHTSTRNLSRALNSLCEEGLLERSKKGVYLIRK